MLKKRESGNDETPEPAWVVLPLPDETVVHPGHGPSTTVGRERKWNQFLMHVDRRQTKEQPS